MKRVGRWLGAVYAKFAGLSRNSLKVPKVCPASEAAGTHQSAAIHGQDNVIVQIWGDGNTVVSGLPHLKLTRYLTRRREAAYEARLLSPYVMAIPLIGR